MFFKKLQWRLVFIFVSITIILMSVVGVVLNNSVETRYYNLFIESVEKPFSGTGQGYWNLGENPSREDLLNYMVTSHNDIWVFRIGDYKQYAIVNRKTNENLINTIDMNEILKSDNYISAAATGEPGRARKLIRINGNAYFDYAKPVGDFILYFRLERGEWKSVIDDFNHIILSSLLIGIVVSIVIGYILSKTITTPIIHIMHKAKKIAHGDFDSILEVKSDDEIGQLTEAFNSMGTELKNKLIEISSEKSKIETILYYMTDGVIAFNLKGQVIHMNPAARAMLGINEFPLEFNEFSQKFGLGVSIEEISYLEISEGRERNIRIQDRYLSVYFAVFTDEEKKGEGVIAVLQDITEQQKLENMRKDFVANVSHELRTPLTSIKSYSETLLDGALEDRETAQKFLSVINSEADRMTRLVKDLLQLSRLDNRQMQWNMHPVCLVELVRDAVEKMALEAKDKKLELESFVIGDIPEINVDRDRIEQVVLNVLSNAIKYTPEGGKVTVYIGKIFSEVYMKVADTGIGIPEQDLGRIFERFYRVDKARSRELGGTGLGLAIAREIVEAHGGSIAAVSKFGQGTEVTVKLPCVIQS